MKKKMEFKTKYGIDQEVYVVHEDELKKLKITTILIDVKSRFYIIYYKLLLKKSDDMMIPDKFIEREEEHCFDLLDGLLNYYKKKNQWKE